MKGENIYEFDLKGFFDNIDLIYNNQAMIRAGFPPEIAKYLTDLNRSIVKLTSKDLIDESEHRKVIYNSDGSLNPNLTEE